MNQSFDTAKESKLRTLDRWAIYAIVATSIVPLVPYALAGA